MSRPTIHLTNWSSRNLHNGRVLTIMARPREWEHGDGACVAFTPEPHDLDAVRAGEMSPKDYLGWCATLFSSRLACSAQPVKLGNGRWSTLHDGDTLCCACSRADAAAGRCHRVAAADVLKLHGWRVILDGAEFAGMDDEYRPVVAGTQGELL